MKSSSSLFPVALMRADTLGSDLLEDTYLLKPNNSPDLTAQIALTRLGCQQQQSRGVPVVLLHGSFSNRGFWLSNAGIGLAAALLSAGYDPWLLEMRGHGDSPINRDYKNNSIEGYAQFDLPAVQAFVKEQTGQSAAWVGHSMGGVTIATSLAGGHLQEEDISTVVLLGSQVTRYPWLLRLPLARLIARLLLLKKSVIKGGQIGPEQEPVGIAKEFARWAGLLNGWKPKKGKTYWHGWRQITTPVLAFGAKKDRGDPATACRKLVEATAGEHAFYLLSQKEGFAKDYGHVDMVVSKEAATDVWPKVITWLDQHK